jgi:hypothetical protein
MASITTHGRELNRHLSWVADLGGWWDEITFQETRETGFLLVRLEQLRVPDYKPCQSESCFSILFLAASISRIYSRPTTRGVRNSHRLSIALTTVTAVARSASAYCRQR